MIDDSTLGMLGLAARARGVVTGVSMVRDALRHDRLKLVVVAADRGSRTEAKVERLAIARGIPVLQGPPAAELGHRVGRGAIQALGITDRALASGMLARTRRSAGGSSGR